MEQSRLTHKLPFPSIRSQLLIISLVVLILPWIGIHTLRDMEDLLKAQQVHNAMTTARTVHDGLLPVMQHLVRHDELLKETPLNSEVALSVSDQRIYIDGYADDWPDDRFNMRYDSSNALQAGKNDTGISFDLSSFHQAHSLILLIDVMDDQLYQTHDPVAAPTDGDHAVLGLMDASGIVHRYIISSSAPGWLRVVRHDMPSVTETRIKAEMQTRSGGYTIEIAIPDALASRRISIHMVDRDNDDIMHMAIIGNVPLTQPPGTGLVFGRKSPVETRLSVYKSIGQRLRVLDSRGNILASEEEINTDSQGALTNERDWLLHLQNLLLLADTVVGESTHHSYRVNDDYVLHALNNQADHRFMRNDQGLGLLSVAIPLSYNDRVVGALLLDQSTEAISGVRHQALIKIILTSVSAMAVIIVILLLYATVLVRRIRNLNRQMQSAVTEDGRLDQEFSVSVIHDEIGELNRGMATMIDRLRSYQHYLETMASKLSHELRTPLSVVQSSLENMQQDSSELQRHSLVERANEGVARLRMILANLTEASRLENALKTTDMERFNLCQVVRGCVEGYRQVFAEARFEYHANIDEYMIDGSAELIAQLMDKLVSNAVDFHEPGSDIDISITSSGSGCRLCVINSGEPVPQQIVNNAFDSMVSARTTTTETPHMGLGLYIVRLIATFHGANAAMSSSNDRVSVCISFR